MNFYLNSALTCKFSGATKPALGGNNSLILPLNN